MVLIDDHNWGLNPPLMTPPRSLALIAGLSYYSYHAHCQGSAFDAHLPFCDGFEDETAMAFGNHGAKGERFGAGGVGFFHSVKIMKCFQMFPASRHFADVNINLLESSEFFLSKTPGCSSPRLCIR